MDEGKVFSAKNPDQKTPVLIVEDSPVQAEMLRRILAQDGYMVTIAKNGAEALELVIKQKPSLIISDILMPVMDGYQLCREINKNEKLRDIPIILLTKLGEVDDVVKGLEADANYYITKPFDADYISSVVSEIIKNLFYYKNLPDEQCTEISFKGKHFKVRAGRGQTLVFLLSTYESALRQNKELTKTQIEIKSLNEHLEEKVRERTAALQESEKRYVMLIESAKDAIISLDASGKIFLWNKMAEAMFGYTAAEAIGRELHVLIAPERYRGKANEGLKSFSQTGAGNVVGKTVEISAQRRDGSEFPVELSVSAMQMQGEWRATGIIRDITGRKQAEESIKRALEKLRTVLGQTIDALASALEMKDPYTAGHQRRVSEIACAIAREMSLPEEEITTLRLAGLVHDIGKICVPSEMLAKPTKLSAIEMELIKTHSAAGYEILKNIEFPWPIARIVLQHHEKTDGSGYPSGISGENILIESRIISVADVVEAMSSHRPYRPALGIDKALDEIARGKGTIYDLVVADACLVLFKEKGFEFHRS